MVEINNNGELNKLVTSSENNAKCPFCHCEFTFKEQDIEIIGEAVVHEKGIKKLLGIYKDYIIHRYITCPWCKAKLKLKFIVDVIDSWEVQNWKI